MSVKDHASPLARTCTSEAIGRRWRTDSTVCAPSIGPIYAWPRAAGGSSLSHVPFAVELDQWNNLGSGTTQPENNVRVATLAIGIAMALMLVTQPWMASPSADLGTDEVTSTAAGAGTMIALTRILASALVIPSPLASTILFSVTAFVGLILAAGAFSDLRLYGVTAVALAVTSLLGWRAKRQRDEDDAIERVQQYQHRRLLA